MNCLRTTSLLAEANKSGAAKSISRIAFFPSLAVPHRESVFALAFCTVAESAESFVSGCVGRSTWVCKGDMVPPMVRCIENLCLFDCELRDCSVAEMQCNVAKKPFGLQVREELRYLVGAINVSHCGSPLCAAWATICFPVP